MRVGYFLSCEEYGPDELVEQAVLAEQAGFRGLWISDHYHPWNDEQGRSPFVWSVIGPEALELAARIGDGFITTQPDGDAVRRFGELKGSDAPCVAGFKVAYASTEEEGLDHAYRLWANAGVPGELAQVLPSPQHVEQASTLVTREAIAEDTVCGDDPAEHRAAFAPFEEAGFDEVYVANMGPNFREMIAFYGDEVLPAVSS